MNEPGLNTDISTRYKPFLDVILEHHQNKVHSVHLVGSALPRTLIARRPTLTPSLSCNGWI